MISIIDTLLYAIMLSYTMNAITVKSITTSAHPELKKVFWSLFVSTRGATNRVKIMSLLRNRPSNPNQLSKNIEIDYKCTSHHLKALEENHLVEKLQGGGITTFFVSPLFEENQKMFDEILAVA